MVSTGLHFESLFKLHIYVDELNIALSNSKTGRDIRGKHLNKFSCADHLPILAPSARTLNNSQIICNNFAKKNLIEFSSVNSLVLLILPKKKIN